MAECEQQKRIPYRKMDCPHCGNEILVKGIDEEQKCPHCKRKYKVERSRHGKKSFWELIAIDYSYEAEGRPRVGARLEREQHGYNSKRRH